MLICIAFGLNVWCGKTFKLINNKETLNVRNRKVAKKDLIIKGINEGLYPESVYKFRTIEKANEILQSLEFYFSSAVNFNDPFDCALDEEKNTLYQTLILG